MANHTVYPYGPGGSLPSGYPIADDLETNSAQQALSARQGVVLDGKIEVINDDLYGADRDVQESVNFASESLYQISMDSGTFYGSVTGNYRCYKIKVPEGMSQVTIATGASSYGTYLCIAKSDVPSSNITGSSFASNYMATGCEGYTPTSPSAYRMVIGAQQSATINLSANAMYIYIQQQYGDGQDLTPGSMVFTGHLRRDGKLDYLEDAVEELSSSASSSMTSGCAPRLYSGRVNSSGSTVSIGYYLTTETIFGDFYIHLANGWKLYEAHLYDRDGKMVSYRYYNPNTPTPINRWNASFALQDYGNANTVPEYGIRLVVCKTNSGAIADGENPVEYFVTMATSGLHRWVPDDLPNYGRALRRLDYLEHLRWVPLAKVFDSSSATTDDYYFNAGNVVVGLSYSDVAETRKYVPNNVSIRTLLTAAKNRRSLLYTENLANNVSKYGMTYKSGYRKCYYGTVCSGLTAWVMGLDTLYLSGQYGSDSIPGLSSVSSPNANNVKPLDLVWCDGHITIISDIYKDDFGAVAFVVLAEMSSPYPHRTLYTPEQFEARLLRNGGYTVHRWSGWENLAEPEASEYTQYLLGQTRKEPEWGGDIMCFAGDYAAFAEGDIIHLNARRNSVYTGVELYKDDVLLQTIDITGLSADTIVTPNTEDWVDVNLTPLNLTYGKYKARLTDGTTTTDYTYFEVIDITFTAAKTGSTVTAYFSSNAGVPVSLERVQSNGFADGYRPITAEMVEAGQATAFNVKSGYPNLILLVKGDYGTVTKTIPIPS